jgi:hypothetical protein
MPGTAKKATFNLSTALLAALDEAMAQGAAPSKKAFVERALDNELREHQRRKRQLLWQEGARDPLLLKDLQEAEAAFLTADAETARRIG